jgi:phage tail-like protein
VGNLTLKRGVARTGQFLKWQMEVAKGQITRRNISVVMYDSAGLELMRWNFANAYPVKWVGPGLNAEQATAAVETLELAHGGLLPG